MVIQTKSRCEQLKSQTFFTIGDDDGFKLSGRNKTGFEVAE